MNKKTKKLGIAASKKELKDAHRIKMEVKAEMREYNHKRMKDDNFVLANQSVHSEHFGETPAQQAERMRK